MAALLGALQGVAEFLPISSSGHLSLAQRWLGIDASAGGHSFNIVVHAGTLLAVLVHYRRDLLDLLRGVLDGQAQARRMALGLIIGTLPLAAALAPGFKELIIRGEDSPRFVGVCLLITAALLAFTHRRHVPPAEPDDPKAVPGPGMAILIGAAQLMATAPGISRSGATIAAALGLGIDRVHSARFSFLLSIPAILGATTVEGLELLEAGSDAALSADVIAIGFVTSFVVGMASLRLLLAMLVRLGLLPFVPYLVLAGAAAIVFGG